MPVIALAPIGVVLIAIVAALLIFGAPAFKRLFSATVGQLPLVGGYIASILNVALDSVTGVLLGWANSAVAAAATLVWGVASAAWSIPAAFVDSIDAAFNLAMRVQARALGAAANALGTAQHLYNVVQAHIASIVADLEAMINTAYLRAVAYASGLAGSLQANINALDGTLRDVISTGLAGVTGLTNTLYQDSLTLLHQTAANLQANINSVDNALSGAVAGVAAGAAQDLANAVNGVEAFAGTAAATAVAGLASDLDHAAHDLLIGPWAVLLPQVETIVEALPGEITAALPGLGALTKGVPISLPGVLSLLTTAVAATAIETARCTVPMCQNLGSLSNLLADLEGAAFWAALVGLVAESVADPHGAATALRQEVSPIVEATATEVRNLVGV